MLFSFYYINQINNVLVYQNNLMEEIEKNSIVYETEFVDAQIYGEYIIPGISGLKVNALESYYNMREFNTFNEYYLLYESVKPVISIENNKDKYIEKGNPLNRNISIIIDDNIFVKDYILKNNLNANILINYDSFIENSFLEQINYDYKNFNRLDSKLENKLCLVTDELLEFCKKKDYYLIKSNIVLNNDNIYDIKKNLSSGQIIILSDILTLENFQIFYNEVLFKDYKIVYLSKLIEE